MNVPLPFISNAPFETNSPLFIRLPFSITVDPDVNSPHFSTVIEPSFKCTLLISNFPPLLIVVVPVFSEKKPIPLLSDFAVTVPPEITSVP